MRVNLHDQYQYNKMLQEQIIINFSYSISKRRLAIADKLKSIARSINECLDNYERDEITDDNSTNEANDDLLL